MFPRNVRNCHNLKIYYESEDMTKKCQTCVHDVLVSDMHPICVQYKFVSNTSMANFRCVHITLTQSGLDTCLFGASSSDMTSQSIYSYTC